MLVIPIKTILLILYAMVVSAVAGGLLYVFVTYPKDPTVKGWMSWAVFVFVVLMLFFFTRAGYVKWV